MSKTPTALVTMRVADLPAPEAADMARCDLCGMAVWRPCSSPRTDKIFCAQCVSNLVKAGDKIERPTKKQLAAVARATRNS